MQTITINGKTLPALGTYEDDRDAGARQVALLLDGRVVTRGTYHETDAALGHSGHGRIGGFANWQREGRDIAFCIDQPSYRDLTDVADRKDLCWSGPKLTLDEYKAWRASLRYEEARDNASLGFAGDAIRALRAWPPINSPVHGFRVRAAIRQLDDMAYSDDEDREVKMLEIVEQLSNLRETF